MSGPDGDGGGLEPTRRSGAAGTEDEGAEGPDVVDGEQGGAPAADAPVADETEAERLARERDEYLDQLRRERAALENLKRRAAAEQDEAVRRGAERLVERLLPVIDTFGYAQQAAERSDDEMLAQGVRMLHDQLWAALGEVGVEEIGAESGEPFDPSVHEADEERLEAAEALGEEVDEPVVVTQLRPGYRMGERVLRAARVQVAG